MKSYKKALALFITFAMITIAYPVDTFAVSKPKQTKITSISKKTSYNFPEVTLKYKKVSCKGYQIYVSFGCNPFYKYANTKNTTWVDDTLMGSEGDVRYKVRAYNTYKQKQYYNSSTKKWVTKKPAKKYWKGKKTKYVSKKVYGKFSNIKLININKNGELYDEAKAKEIEKKIKEEQEELASHTIEWYSKKFTEKWYSILLEKLHSYDNSKYRDRYISKQDEIILNNDFYELSDAMKVYALARSEYFGCNTPNSVEDNTYCMRYTGDSKYGSNPDSNGNDKYTMKLLYDGKCIGACGQFALAETVYFDSLGIKAYALDDWNYEPIHGPTSDNHAWSVVKCKNSKGKLLYIPFDYGINYSNFTVTEEDIRDMKERGEHFDNNDPIWTTIPWKIFVRDVKGATEETHPKMEDFN